MSSSSMYRVADLAALAVGVPVAIDRGLEAGHGGGHAGGHGKPDDDVPPC